MLLALLLASATVLPYHLQLEANPAAPFPLLKKFGVVTLHVYPAGVRADSMWLNGFSLDGATVTVENPYARMYTEVPVMQFAETLEKMAHVDVNEGGAPPIAPPVAGTVGGMSADRYRLIYGPDAWIDIWTSHAVPANAQLKNLIDGFVRGIAPLTANALRSIPGTPIYVEINFSRYKKMPVVWVKSFVASSAGEQNALRVGRFYFKVPLLDALWK
ncbi:MAG TPA: hypothetical protein VL284_06620 [Thermoanaerobaculia bacterium]|nr:hypothetical protein [Thermoanaerobaculia bacterium]